MFSGIVEGTVLVVAFDDAAPASAAAREGVRVIRVDLGALADGLAPGASVCINGVCLTLTGAEEGVATFDVIPQTWKTTNLDALRAGSRVNVERSLRVGDRLDGHFVQGHVDGVGRVCRLERGEGGCKVWIEPPGALRRYVIPKGSIALNGVSLTISDVQGERFAVALVPTTLARTNLGDVREGDAVNIETDVLVRTIIERMEAGGEWRMAVNEASSLSDESGRSATSQRPERAAARVTGSRS